MLTSNKLLGFEVYNANTGEPIRDRNFAITHDGKLILETRTGYMEVPKDGKFIVHYGTGSLEIW